MNAETLTLTQKADFIRKKLVDLAVKNGAEHIAPSLSTVDILTALYYSILNIPDPNSPDWEDRDRFVLSKGHGCYGFYAILHDLGIIPDFEWENFHLGGSSLTGCVERNPKYGLEAGCGSLGHGLPIAVGIALGAKLQGKKFKVYCMVGDGEMQEGSMWEAVQFAAKHKLDNLTVIVDNNGLQAMDFLENILTKTNEENDLRNKLSAFGFKAVNCNGHSINEVEKILKSWNGDGASELPKALIAKTTKGYGLLCMENVPKFHYRMPTQEELRMGNRYE